MWQPLSTAPRDGTQILVVHRDRFRQIVKWKGRPDAQYPWRTPDGAVYYRDDFTDWHELPELPKGAET